MKTGEREWLYEVYSKLAAAWLELGQAINTLREGEEAEELMRAKAKIKEGLNTVFSSLEVQEYEKR